MPGKKAVADSGWPLTDQRQILCKHDWCAKAPQNQGSSHRNRIVYKHIPEKYGLGWLILNFLIFLEDDF